VNRASFSRVSAATGAPVRRQKERETERPESRMRHDVGGGGGRVAADHQPVRDDALCHDPACQQQQVQHAGSPGERFRCQAGFPVNGGLASTTDARICAGVMDQYERNSSAVRSGGTSWNPCRS